MSLRAGYGFKPPEQVTNTKLAALVGNATLGVLTARNFVGRLVDGPADIAGLRTTDTAAAGNHDHSDNPLNGQVILTATITEEKLLKPVPLSAGGVGQQTGALSGLQVVVKDATTGELKLASIPIPSDTVGFLRVDLSSPYFMTVGA